MSLNSFKYQVLPSTIYNKKKIKKNVSCAIALHYLRYSVEKCTSFSTEHETFLQACYLKPSIVKNYFAFTSPMSGNTATNVSMIKYFTIKSSLFPSTIASSPTSITSTSNVYIFSILIVK